MSLVPTALLVAMQSDPFFSDRRERLVLLNAPATAPTLGEKPG